MPAEIPQQIDMFSGELVDTRSAKQKRRDREHSKPQQSEMFAAREIAQFGVQARPTLPGVNAKGLPIGMALEVQDPRTDEKKEHDRMAAAQDATYALFGAEPVQQEESTPTRLFPSGIRLELHEIEEDPSNQAIQLAEGVAVLYWGNRDEGYEHADLTVRQAGYIPRLSGDDHLELWKHDETGYFRITYSPMDMVENIEWIATPDASG